MSVVLTPEQWSQRKEEILRLYIDESLPLKLVMRRMRSDDFDPSESQYRTRLKMWKRRKPRGTRRIDVELESSVSGAATSDTTETWHMQPGLQYFVPSPNSYTAPDHFCNSQTIISNPHLVNHRWNNWPENTSGFRSAPPTVTGGVTFPTSDFDRRPDLDDNPPHQQQQSPIGFEDPVPSLLLDGGEAFLQSMPRRNGLEASYGDGSRPRVQQPVRMRRNPIPITKPPLDMVEQPYSPFNSLSNSIPPAAEALQETGYWLPDGRLGQP